MVSTDAGTMYDNGIAGHPQDAGTYPRFFNKMVREQGAMTYLEAIRRCTLLPARRLGLKNKGRLACGADADILVFHPEQIQDTAQYPCYGRTDSRPEGIRFVLVNGQVIVRGSEVLDKKPGRILRSTKKSWDWNSGCGMI